MEITPEQLGGLRLRAQCLTPWRSRHELVEVVRTVCGVNAQFTPAMLLSLRARIKGLTLDEVQAAIADSRTLVRTWAVRGTLHLLAAEDARWLVALLGPRLAAQDARRRLQLGLDEEKCVQALQEMQTILAHGEPLTRWELVDRLNEQGVTIERQGQAAIHLISLAAFKSLLCLGPERANGDKTYALTRRWVGHKPSPQPTALDTLARRYLAGYGPATLQDFAGWSGLPVAAARTAWESLRAGSEWAEVQVDGQALRAPTAALNALELFEPHVRLLPAFDTYLLGYADRRHVVPPRYQREVYHGGQTVPVVLVNGAAAGVW
ncbi:MAG: winged helix DNA-binding domain-containing protein, partial [Anaerolineae bacterium]